MLRYLMLDFLSEEAAAKVFHFANAGLVVALIVGVVSTWVIYASGTVKEKYTNAQLEGNRLETARAQKAASEASERAAKLDLERAKLETALEKERAARLKLESHLTPRRVSAAEKSELVARLVPFAGQKCALSWSSGDEEARAYAYDFASVLTDARWDFDLTQTVYLNATTGICVMAHANEHGLPELLGSTLALMQCLGDLQPPADRVLVAATGVPAGNISVRIGSKRPMQV